LYAHARRKNGTYDNAESDSESIHGDRNADDAQYTCKEYKTNQYGKAAVQPFLQIVSGELLFTA